MFRTPPLETCRWTFSTDLHVRTWQVNWELPAAATVTVFQCRAAEPVPSPLCLLILESRCSGSRTIRQPQASFLSLASLKLFFFSASASLSVSLSLPWAVHRIILSLHLVFNFLLSSALWCSRCSLRQRQCTVSCLSVTVVKLFSLWARLNHRWWEVCVFYQSSVGQDQSWSWYPNRDYVFLLVLTTVRPTWMIFPFSLHRASRTCWYPHTL